MKKRRDKKGRILRDGECQRANGLYQYNCVDANGEPRCVYSWKLEPTDPLPTGKRKCLSLREKEREIQKDISDGIVSCGGNMTVLGLVKKYVGQKTGVRNSTQTGYQTVINLLEKEAFGKRRIDHQLMRTSQMKYIIEPPKTEAGERILPLQDEVCECFRRIIQNRKKPKNQGDKGVFSTMTKILFVCHGNICRSPMAEFIMKKLVADCSEQFHIESRATSTEELGNPVYPPARRKLSEHGISCDGKYAQRITRKDYESFDYVICMDGRNLRNITYVIGEDDEEKVSRLMEYTDTPGDVADPWYTDDFETTYRDILRGCKGLLEKLTK